MSGQPREPQTVTLEDAYREACLALGEAIVRERLLARLVGTGDPVPNGTD